MPFQLFIEPSTGQFYDTQKIREILEKDLDPSKETIASCGTGISSYCRSHTRCYGKHTLSRTGGKRISFKEERI